jgi:dsRNA-specific ribonuclease
MALLKLTGDYQKSKGDASAKNTVLPQIPKAVFESDAKKKPVLKPREEIVVKKQADKVAEDVVDAVVGAAVAEGNLEDVAEAAAEVVAEVAAEEVVAEAAADVMTGPLSAMLALLKHPLTDNGLAQFLADHAKANS